jgi:hypothetical protein
MACSCFPIKIMCIFLTSPVCSTYPVGLIHLVLTYRIIFAEGTNYGDRDTVFSTFFFFLRARQHVPRMHLSRRLIVQFSTFLLVLHCQVSPFSWAFSSQTSRCQILMATEYHDYGLLGYDAVQFGTWIRYFCFCPRDRESRLFETLVPSS